MMARATPANDPRPLRFYTVMGLVAVAFTIGLVSELPGHLFNATRFILYDQGSYLYAIDCWQRGEGLYRDFAWQYGPLALGWYRVFAAGGGNTPLTLVMASTLAFGIGWALVAWLVARVVGRVAGGAFAVVVLLPVMVATGPFAFNGPHGALELMLLAVCASSLAGAEATGVPGWRLGVAAGLLQWVRFGPHAVALIAIWIITAWRCWPGRLTRDYVRGLAFFSLRLVAGYAVTVLPLAAWYFTALPAAGAWEQLWPRYMVGHYAATYEDRWPQIASGWEFTQIWLPAVLGLGTTVIVLVRGFARSGPSAAPTEKPAAVAGLLFFPLYYLLGCGLLFRNAYSLGGHLWLVWPGLVVIMAMVRLRWLRLTLLIAAVPALATVWQGMQLSVAREREWHPRPLRLPNGQQLWFHGEEERNFGILATELGEGPRTKRVAVFIAGGGIHHFYGAPRAGRQWWFLPEFVRPWEEAAARQSLLKHERLFVADMGQMSGKRAGVITLWLPLPPGLRQAVLPHLSNPRPVGTLGTMVDVAP